MESGLRTEDTVDYRAALTKKEKFETWQQSLEKTLEMKTDTENYRSE